MRFFKGKWRRRIFAALAVSYVLFVFVVSDWLVIMPVPGHIDAGAARREFLSADGKRLECWVAPSDALGRGTPQGYVLEFCGNARYCGCRIIEFMSDSRR